MAKKEAEKDGSQFDGNIYHGKRYTVPLAIHAAGADELEWQDVDFRSDIDDKREALIDYIKRTFGDDIEIEEVDKNTLRVSDPLFADGECLRDYRLD